MSAQFMRRNIRISVRLTEEEHRDLYGRGRALSEEAFRKQVSAFHDRKYASDFSREMSRSAAEYWKPFMRWQE